MGFALPRITKRVYKTQLCLKNQSEICQPFSEVIALSTTFLCRFKLQVLESSTGRTAPCWRAWWARGRQFCVPRSSPTARRLNLPRQDTVGRKERPDLPASLLMVLHALQLECEKSMELIASSRHSCFFSFSWEGRGGSARGSPHLGSDKGVIEGLALFVPAWHIVLPAATWDALFSRWK